VTLVIIGLIWKKNYPLGFVYVAVGDELPCEYEARNTKNML